MANFKLSIISSLLSSSTFRLCASDVSWLFCRTIRSCRESTPLGAGHPLLENFSSSSCRARTDSASSRDRACWYDISSCSAVSPMPFAISVILDLTRSSISEVYGVSTNVNVWSGIGTSSTGRSPKNSTVSRSGASGSASIGYRSGSAMSGSAGASGITSSSCSTGVVGATAVSGPGAPPGCWYVYRLSDGGGGITPAVLPRCRVSRCSPLGSLGGANAGISRSGAVGAWNSPPVPGMKNCTCVGIALIEKLFNPLSAWYAAFCAVIANVMNASYPPLTTLSARLVMYAGSCAA